MQEAVDDVALVFGERGDLALQAAGRRWKWVARSE
jgi:hypothetical protein